MPPKRKRGEPSLEENLAKWRKELIRGLKTAKGFERQRLSKRLREADPEKTARLEKEVLVLKSLDLHQAAHAHLCSSLLRIKGVAESPKLPADIKPVPKPELSEDEKSALHNVTSALCNRKQVKDVVEEAIMGTCIALRVPMPDKRKKGKGKETPATATKDSRAGRGQQAEDQEADVDSLADDESDDAEAAELDGPPLLRRKAEKAEGGDDLESDASSENSDSPEFEGFSDSDAEEQMFSKYDDLVGGSSDEEDSEDQDDNDSDRANSKARAFRKLALDDISLSSATPDDSEESEDEALAPPTKKPKTKNVAPVSFDTGGSAFLPSLMGGYISGSESASDVDVAPPVRKNRRGQRARQAIWDKKYGEKAKHHSKETDSRNQGWDMKRGAVDGDTAKPWKQGISNPFEKSNVHPSRQRQMQGDGERQARAQGSKDIRERRPPRQQDNGNSNFQAEKPKPKPPPSRDDTGPLHPSWAAAKKAKEGVAKVEFKGKKVTFD
ncbi:Bud-site selection protein [Astrocystis sublimbata]|nr:Bud-site selection protein [Astrocystis sublimbata]